VEWISNPEIWTALLTLLFLEVVLGVDNVIFISILAASSRPISRTRPAVPDCLPPAGCGSSC